MEGYDPHFFTLFRKERSSDARHFWFRARNEIILALYHAYPPPGARPKFLDVGCGSGVVLEYLIQHGVAAEGLDAFPEALRACRARTGASVWLADARRLPFSGEFDAIGLFDCLEHILDDDAVLAGVRRALCPKGVVFLTVPAEPHLWSQLDVAFGHFRRYAKAELTAKLHSAGLEILKLSHYNLLVLPFYWLHRLWLLPLLSRSRGTPAVPVEKALRVPPVFLNELLYRLMRSERWLLQRGALPYGTSLLVVARRPSESR